MMLEISTDGACSGNPGKRGIGVVISENGKIIKRVSEPAGFGTNNEAEYLAVIRALEEAHLLHADSVKITSDSQLIIMQLQGRYKVKSEGLKKLKSKADSLIKKFKSVEFVWAGREGNFSADALAKAASLR
jgi:ribonuclease HI